jgi:hypothetical protein
VIDTINTTNIKGRGRPLGFRLSELSKQSISDSKKGQRHSEETKEKISKTLMQYFRNTYPLSDELYIQYKYEIDNYSEVREWFDRVSTSYNETNNICTERSLNSKRFREISIEYNISMEDNPNLTTILNSPEDVCDLREQCDEHDLDFDAVCDVLGVKF